VKVDFVNIHALIRDVYLAKIVLKENALLGRKLVMNVSNYVFLMRKKMLRAQCFASMKNA
jgi:bifunctional DNase/RNase